MLAEQTKRALIVVRTYPVPSKSGIEVSCTAAITDQGEWLRLFPVPWRLLERDRRFRKYQWVDVTVTKARDTRPESYKLKPDGITIVSEPLGTDNFWQARKDIVFPQSGGGGSVVMAFAVSGERTGGSVADPIINGTVFLCSELAQAGSLTITPQILQQLPAGTGILGLQTVTPGSSGNFTTTLTNGSPLAFGHFYLSVGATKSGSFR